MAVFAAGDDKEHVVLWMGELESGMPLVRIHSECLTGDAFMSLRCDCGPQLQSALAQIAAEGRGAVLYLRQEGRGIGLANKIRAYALQDQGHDTVEANETLGFPADARDYSLALDMLFDLDLRRVRKASDPASPLSRGLSMAFFKFGAPPGRDVILELVGPGTSDAPVGATVAAERAGFPVSEHASIAGMVVEVPSIAPLASLLGSDLIGEERDAAQGGGRRIAPLKHKAAGLPLPLAFITPSTA